MSNKKLIAVILASSLCLTQCLGSVAMASSADAILRDPEIVLVDDNTEDDEVDDTTSSTKPEISGDLTQVGDEIVVEDNTEEDEVDDTTTSTKPEISGDLTQVDDEIVVEDNTEDDEVDDTTTSTKPDLVLKPDLSEVTDTEEVEKSDDVYDLTQLEGGKLEIILPETTEDTETNDDTQTTTVEKPDSVYDLTQPEGGRPEILGVLEEVIETFVKPVNFTDAGPLIDPVTVPIVEAEDDEFSMYIDQDSSSLISPMAMMMSLSDDYGIATIDEEPESDTDDGVILNKSVSDEADTNGYYTISLESYTTGEVKYATTGTPTDIILVLDQSASMYENFDGESSIEVEDYIFGQSFIDTDIGETYYVPSEQGNVNWENTRQYALIEAVRDFIDAVNEDAATYNTEGGEGFYHRISVVAYSEGYGESAASDGYEQDSALGLFLDDNVNTYSTLTSYPNGADRSNTTNYDDTYYGNYDSTQSVTNAFVTLDGTTDTDNAAEINQLKKWVQQLDADRGTPTDSGMNEAYQIMNMLDENEERNQVVILFTDGAPKNETDEFFDIDLADEAIKYAYDMKTDYDATVYSVGIFSGADPTEISGAANANEGTSWTVSASGGYLASDSSINNRFMNFVSSKSDDAQNLGVSERTSGTNTGYTITNAYNWDDQAAYYLTAGDSDGLSNIFTSISDQITVSSVELTATTQVRDYVSEYFQMPEAYSVAEIFDNLSLEVIACEGENSSVEEGEDIYNWAGSGITFAYSGSYTNNDDGTYTATFESDSVDYDLTVTYDEEQKGIIVNGFDYNDNCVSTSDKGGDDYGSKLVIEFDIERADDFIGGNSVVTNTSQSGIYVAGSEGAVDDSYVYSSLEFFDVPETDVVIIYDLTTTDQTIFLGNIIALDKILQIHGHEVFGFSNYYVDITFYVLAVGTITDDGSFDIDSVTDYEEDGTTPKYNDTFIAKFSIPAQTSATDALALYKDSLPEIMPAECTSYDIFCVVTPSEDSSTDKIVVTDFEEHEPTTTVHVLQPQITGHDLWVDYGAVINLREDGTSPITWKGLDHGDTEHDEHEYDNLYEANAEYPPTVYYIYHNQITDEYFKTSYTSEWGDEEASTIDGGTVTIDGGTPLLPSEVSDSKYYVTVRDDIDIDVVGDREYEIVGLQILSSDGYENVSYASIESYIFEDIGDDITKDNEFEVYVNEYSVAITKTVNYDDYMAYPQSFIFEVSQTEHNNTTADSDDIVNTIKVIMMPEDFSKSEDTDLLTCTATVSGLFAGLETTVVEDTDWSWRYTLKNSTTEVVGFEVTAGEDANAGDVELGTGYVYLDNKEHSMYGTVNDDGSITVNYYHALYKNEEDNNKNGFNDTIVDVNGNGIPEDYAIVFNDRNGDTYVDIDILSPTADELDYGYYTHDYTNETEHNNYAPEHDLKDTQEYSGDFDYFDIPFDMDGNGYIDLVVSAATVDSSGYRLITASKTYYTSDFFVGFYIDPDGNIVGADKSTMVFNRNTKYFDGYYIDYLTLDDDAGSAMISGGNGGIYAKDDTEMLYDLSGSSDIEFYLTKVTVGGETWLGHNYGEPFDEIVIVSYLDDDKTVDKTYFGTALMMIGEPEDLTVFDRDADGTYTDPLPLQVRDTYRYVNTNGYLVFAQGIDAAQDADTIFNGIAPADGLIQVGFTNDLTIENWLSRQDAIANKFDGDDVEDD